MPANSPPTDRPSPRHRVIAHVDLDAFFTSVEQLLNPRLAGRPVVVGGRADQRGVVASASYEARARGIYVPMPLTRAYRICPEAHFLPGRHDEYRAYSKRVFDVCRSFSPNIEQTGIDEAYLDWTSSQWMSRNPLRPMPRHWPLDLAECLRDAVLADTGLCVSVGIGANRLIAKIAGKYCKPRGLCHVARGAEAAFLGPLPLRIVPGIGRRASEILDAAGLVLIGDVQQLSDDALSCRVGPGWAQRLRRISEGRASDLLVLDHDPKSISNERTFAIDCRDLNEVRRTLYRLTERAAWRLRRAGLKAGTISVKLRSAAFETRTRAVSFGYRTDCHHELYLAASRLLDDLSARTFVVRLVGVQLSNLGPVGGRQLTLFDEQRFATSGRIDRAIDTVRDRLGYARICTAAGIMPIVRRKPVPRTNRGKSVPTPNLPAPR